MYNPDMKRRFIEMRMRTVVINETAYESIFSKTEKFENESGKDVSLFSYKEICDMYRMWNILSYNYLLNINSILSIYTDFCISEGKVNNCQNHFSEISSSDINSFLNNVIRSMQIVSREEVLSVVNSLKNPRDQFCLLALFEYNRGKEYRDIYGVHIEDINIEEGKVALPSGRVVHVSKELINIAINSAEEYTYYSSSKVNYLEDDGTGINIVKSFKGRSLSKRSVYNCMIKALSYFNGAVTPNSLVDSGRIHFIHERAKELNISTLQYMYKYAEEIGNQFNAKFIPNMFNKKFNDYL